MITVHLTRMEPYKVWHEITSSTILYNTVIGGILLDSQLPKNTCYDRSKRPWSFLWSSGISQVHSFQQILLFRVLS